MLILPNTLETELIKSTAVLQGRKRRHLQARHCEWCQVCTITKYNKPAVSHDTKPKPGAKNPQVILGSLRFCDPK